MTTHALHHARHLGLAYHGCHCPRHYPCAKRVPPVRGCACRSCVDLYACRAEKAWERAAEAACHGTAIEAERAAAGAAGVAALAQLQEDTAEAEVDVADAEELLARREIARLSYTR